MAELVIGSGPGTRELAAITFTEAAATGRDRVRNFREADRLDLDVDARARVRVVLADVDEIITTLSFANRLLGEFPWKRPAQVPKWRTRSRPRSFRPPMGALVDDLHGPRPRGVLDPGVCSASRAAGQVARIFDDNWDRLGPWARTALTPVDVSAVASPWVRPRPLDAADPTTCSGHLRTTPGRSAGLAVRWGPEALLTALVRAGKLSAGRAARRLAQADLTSSPPWNAEAAAWSGARPSGEVLGVLADRLRAALEG